tara:strand:+ start:243 stop:584 length:342 start_codon:yes stop_codon:yes gene_type:complete
MSNGTTIMVMNPDGTVNKKETERVRVNNRMFNMFVDDYVTKNIWGDPDYTKGRRVSQILEKGARQGFTHLFAAIPGPNQEMFQNELRINRMAKGYVKQKKKRARNKKPTTWNY